MLPEIKKELKSFILEEKGGAQKQVLISLGAMLAGLEALNLVSQIVSGATISAKHDHCDPGHISSGWGSMHSNADGVPSSHCNSHANSAGWNSYPNVAHKNYIVLSYG